VLSEAPGHCHASSSKEVTSDSGDNKYFAEFEVTAAVILTAATVFSVYNEA
jgi:hypothetical protein